MFLYSLLWRGSCALARPCHTFFLNEARLWSTLSYTYLGKSFQICKGGHEDSIMYLESFDGTHNIIMHIFLIFFLVQIKEINDIQCFNVVLEHTVEERILK